MIRVAILGFHKCGTTALFEMLGQHPDLCPHTVGQPPRFLESENFRDEFETIRETYFANCHRSSDLLLRDNRLIHSLPALERLRRLSPDATLALSVRNPADRAYSAYWHAVERGFEQELSFDDVLRLGATGERAGRPPLMNYLSMGFYHRSIKALETVFPPNQVVLLESSGLKAHPGRTCQSIFRAAGLAPYDITGIERNRATAFRSKKLGRFVRSESRTKAVARSVIPPSLRAKFLKKLNAVNTTEQQRPPMTDHQREKLNSIFADENRKLLEDYGIAFNDAGTSDAKMSSDDGSN